MMFNNSLRDPDFAFRSKNGTSCCTVKNLRSFLRLLRICKKEAITFSKSIDYYERPNEPVLKLTFSVINAVFFVRNHESQIKKSRKTNCSY